MATLPGAQAKKGRCLAAGPNRETCWRWKGHTGPHRGTRFGEFYQGTRNEWMAYVSPVAHTEQLSAAEENEI